jgi:uncharacterized repeat protein (TIGR03943 family)
MGVLVKKDAQAVLLLLVGGTILKISLTGTYVRYVKPGLLPLLLIAGVVLIVVALVTLWQVIRAPKEVPDRAAAPARAMASGGGAMWPEPFSASSVSAPPAGLALPPPADRAASAALAVAMHEGHGPIPDLAEPEPLVATPAPAPSGHDQVSADADHSTDPDHSTNPDHSAADHEDADDGHGHGQSRVGWLLLAPALALLLFAPPALGSYQASRNGTALGTQQDSDFPPLPSGDPLRISVLDYAGRAVFDKGKSLQGRRLTLSGFVIAGPNGQPYLARMIVSCCAADARPVKVGLAGDIPATLKADEWIEIEGSYIDRADKDPVNSDLVPYIQVASVRDVAAPEQQYES